MLYQGTPARKSTFTWCFISIPAIVLKNPIWHFSSFVVLVKFMLHNHRYFNWDTISSKTDKAQVFFLPMTQTIPHWMPTQYFMVLGLLLLLLLKLTLFYYCYLIRLRYYQWDLVNFLQNIFWHNNNKVSWIFIYKSDVIMARELTKSLQWYKSIIIFYIW